MTTGGGSLKELPLPAKIFSDTSAKIVAAILGGVYALGYFVVTLNNAHYGFYDAGLFHPRIVSAGCALIVAVGLPTCFVFYGSMLLPILPRDPLRPDNQKSAHGALITFLVAATFASSVLSMASRPIFEEGHQGGIGIWKVALYSFLLILIVSGVQASVTHWTGPSPATVLWQRLAWVGTLIIDGYLVWLGCSAALDCVQFRWLMALSVYIAGMRFDFDSTEKLKRHPWISTTIMAVLIVSSFTHYVYPIMKPFWGGMPQPIKMTLEAKAPAQHAETIEAKLIEQTNDGFYVLLGNRSHATFIPRGLVSRIEY